MKPKVYGIGYSGRKLHEIRQLVQDLDAVVFDIRFSPRSRAPQWNGNRLSDELGSDRYLHVKEFGNKNYRGGPIELVDYEGGKSIIEASTRPIILMCVCKDPAICHRTLIMGRLEMEGFEVEELNRTKPRPSQLKLGVGIL